MSERVQKADKMFGYQRASARDFLRERDGWNCFYCEKDFTNPQNAKTVTLDHVRPRSLGGENDIANLVLACKKCNQNRGTLDFKVFCLQGKLGYNRSDKNFNEQELRSRLETRMNTYLQNLIQTPLDKTTVTC